MSAPVKFTLILYVSESRRRDSQHVTADVQCWQDEKCIANISLSQGWEFTWPEGTSLDTAENYASAAARIAARHLGDIQMSAVEKEILNYRAALEAGSSHDA